MNEHRIEIICKTPKGSLETITITVSADAKPSMLSTLTKNIRGVLEQTLFAEPPLTIETVRDYPL